MAHVSVEEIPGCCTAHGESWQSAQGQIVKKGRFYYHSVSEILEKLGLKKL